MQLRAVTTKVLSMLGICPGYNHQLLATGVAALMEILIVDRQSNLYWCSLPWFQDGVNCTNLTHSI